MLLVRVWPQFMHQRDRQPNKSVAVQLETVAIPDLAMDGKDKGADVQEEHGVHGLVGEAVQPPHMKHMRHGQHLHTSIVLSVRLTGL